MDKKINKIANEFRQRASSAHLLFTNPRSKKAKELGELAETVKSMVTLAVKEKLYDRKFKSGKTKYTENGIFSEDGSIKLLSKKDGVEYINNEKEYFSDMLTGTPDILTKDYVIDIKTSFSGATFPLFEEELNPLYETQVQVYMNLTGRKKAKVVYVLHNVADHIIEKEYWREHYVCPYTPATEYYTDHFKEFRKDYLYDNIPDDLRFRTFEVAYDEDKINQIHERVKMCREYIKTLTI